MTEGNSPSDQMQPAWRQMPREMRTARGSKVATQAEVQAAAESGQPLKGKLARCETKVNPIRHNISARHTREPDIRRLFGCPLTP